MLRQNTYKKGVLWMLLFNGLARGISFILGIILAKNFLPQETDIYLYVWSIINVVMMIVSSVNLMVVSPAYIILQENNDKEGAAKICSAFLNIYLIPLLLFAVIALVLPMFTYGVISGFSSSQLLPYKEMLRFSGVWLTLVIVNIFIGNIFLSRKFFVIYILGQVIAATVTLVFILLFKKRLGIESFFIGQFAGNVICLFFYLYLLKSKLNQKLKLFYYYVPYKIVRELGAVLIISVPTLVINFLLVYYLSRFETGQLSAYNYGSALANLPDVIFLSQFISVFGVRFAEIVARRENDFLFDTFRHFGNHLFFFMSGVAVVLSLTSVVIIQLVYGRESLETEVFSSAVVSLSLLAASLPFKSLDVLNNRLFASIQALSSLVKYTLPVKLANIGLLVFLANQYGFRGILVHQVLMPAVMVLMQIYLLGKFFPADRIRKYFFQILFLLGLGIAVYAGSKYLVDYVLVNTNPLLEIMLIFILVLIVGFIVEKLFRLTSFSELIYSKISAFNSKGKE